MPENSNATKKSGKFDEGVQMLYSKLQQINQ